MPVVVLGGIVGFIVVALFESPCLIGNLVAIYYPQARRHCAHSSESEDRLGGYGAERTRLKRECRARLVRFDIVVRRVQYLPDPIEIGMAIGSPGYVLKLLGETRINTEGYDRNQTGDGPEF